MSRVLNGQYAQDLYNDVNEGDEFEDDGRFGSFTDNEMEHSNFIDNGRSLVLELNGDDAMYPRDISGVSHQEAEAEYLMPRNARYRVVGKNRGGIYNRLQLEVMNPEDLE